MKNTLFALILSGALAATSFAQINQRFENQQRRIGNGIADGRLNARQGANLERKESAVRQEVHADRVLDNGHLTRGERVQINHQQNSLSRQIYRDKH